jgi:hypothetical protein
MEVSLLIDGIPPDRTHSGRCADRHSPNAEPLARGGRRTSWRDEATSFCCALRSVSPSCSDERRPDFEALARSIRSPKSWWTWA